MSNQLRGLYVRGPRRVRTGQLVVDNHADTTPAMPPFHIAASAEPTVAGVKGDLYFDSTANALMQYNGTAWEEVGSTQSGDFTVVDDLNVGDDLNLTSTGAVITIGPAATDPVVLTHSANKLTMAAGDTFEAVTITATGVLTGDDITAVDDLNIGDDLNLTSTGAVITVGPSGTDPVVITHSANVLTLAAGDKIVSPLAGFGVETGGGAATLTPAQSGGVFAFNNATGFLYTLPAAVAGLRYTFVVETTVSSGVDRVACAAGDFLLGTIQQFSDGTLTIVPRDANGSTHLAWEGDGSTTGGIKGDWFEVVAISGTQWRVWGFNTATGTEATPFKTS